MCTIHFRNKPVFIPLHARHPMAAGDTEMIKSDDWKWMPKFPLNIKLPKGWNWIPSRRFNSKSIYHLGPHLNLLYPWPHFCGHASLLHSPVFFRVSQVPRIPSPCTAYLLVFWMPDFWLLRSFRFQIPSAFSTANPHVLLLLPHKVAVCPVWSVSVVYLNSAVEAAGINLRLMSWLGVVVN